LTEPLTFALVTDIHSGRASLTKRGPEALRLVEEFVEFAETSGPDLVVELGDRVTDTDAAADRASLEQVAELFAPLSVPRQHIMGNHDLVNLSVADNEECLGQTFASSSVDLKGWHLVFWQADVAMSASHHPRLAAEDLEWLEADLTATELPAVVFTHVPLDGASMTGNFYFQSNPEFAGYSNTKRAQQIISESEQVALCVAGHVHWNNVSRIDGVPYLSLQSLTESFTTQGQAAASWASITLDEQLHWRGHGGDPIELSANLGGVGQRWTPPLPTFEELAARRRG
jgi:predicted phosphodiesterase